MENYEQIDKLYELINNDDKVRTAFLSMLNTLFKISCESPEYVKLLKSRYRSWDELDEAGGKLDVAIQKNEAFQEFLEVAEGSVKTLAKIALKGVI